MNSQTFPNSSPSSLPSLRSGSDDAKAGVIPFENFARALADVEGLAQAVNALELPTDLKPDPFALMISLVQLQRRVASLEQRLEALENDNPRRSGGGSGG